MRPNNFKEHIAKTLVARIKYRDTEFIRLQTENKRLQTLVRQNSCMICGDFANDHISLDECAYCDNRVCDDCRQGMIKWSINCFRMCLDCQGTKCNKCGELTECHECKFVSCHDNYDEDPIYKIRICKDCSVQKECLHGMNYFCSQSCRDGHFMRYTEKCSCGKIACTHGSWIMCAAKCSTILCGTCGLYCAAHKNRKGFVGFTNK